MNGAEFKALRESLGLSQREAAEILGYSGKTAVSNLEARRVPPSLLPSVLLKALAELPEKRSLELQDLLRSLRVEEERSRRKIKR